MLNQVQHDTIFHVKYIPLLLVSSVPTNIVEGFKRKSSKDFTHFLNIADAYLEETKYHLILACDLGYLAKDDYKKLDDLCNEVGRMLYGLQKKLNP